MSHNQMTYNKRYHQARNTAVRKLIERHKAEFVQIFTEERAKAGIRPLKVAVRERRIAKLQADAKALGMHLTS